MISRKALLLAGLACLVLARPAWADCGADASSGEVQACLAQDLRDSDKRINAVYKLLMANLEDQQKLGLRDAQRAWLKSRDKACSLDNKESDRERWLQAIMADQGKTACVVRYTFDRVAQLNAMLKQTNAAAAPDIPAAPEPPQLNPIQPSAARAMSDALTLQDDGYVVASRSVHERGKWYMEMQIDWGGIAALGDALLTPGITSAEGGVIRMVSIRRSHRAAPPLAIGLAVDLDNGFIYWRQSGMWREQPGSAGGAQVKLGRPYWLRVEGSTEMRELLRRGLVTVNLGDKPFQYAMPDGYRPFAEQ
jgi:uncharacterized protein YecT (DUF1311 family)